MSDTYDNFNRDTLDSRFTDTSKLESLREMVLDTIPLGEIYPSHIHGYGLFAKEDIREGTILCIMNGQIMRWYEYKESCTRIKAALKEQDHPLFLEWNCLGTGSGVSGTAEDTYLLVRPFRTKYSLINHSRTPNCQLLYNPLRVVAMKDIQEGEELTFDYRTEPLPQEYYDEHGYSYL